MKALDQNTIERLHIPEIVLVEQAASAFVEEMKAKYPMSKTVHVVCGIGNNGADGVAIARLLAMEGIKACIYIPEFAERKKCSVTFAQELDIYEAHGFSIINHDTFLQFPDEEKEHNIVVDAMFGIGLSRMLSEEWQKLISEINELPCTKIAVDIASGVDANDGQVMGDAILCDATIAFGYAKVGNLLWPGNLYAGEVSIVPLGINSHSWFDKKPHYFCVQKEDVGQIPQRPRHSHKGNYGKVLLIAGEREMAGAAILAATAAYRAGAGLVKVFTPEENRTILLSKLPEAIPVSYGKTGETKLLLEALKWADAVVVGPGMGTGEQAQRIVHTVLKNTTVPTVLDADALNIIADETEILKHPHVEFVVTPHLGEMSRLTKYPISYIENHMIPVAEEFANQYNVTTVLKDSNSVVAIPYGNTYINTSGNPGMATAGSGDVLAGILGAFLAQGMEQTNSIALGVYIHGLAADIQVEKYGEYGMIASDILMGITIAMKEDKS